MKEKIYNSLKQIAFILVLATLFFVSYWIGKREGRSEKIKPIDSGLWNMATDATIHKLEAEEQVRMWQKKYVNAVEQNAKILLFIESKKEFSQKTITQNEINKKQTLAASDSVALFILDSLRARYSEKIHSPVEHRERYP